MILSFRSFISLTLFCCSIFNDFVLQHNPIFYRIHTRNKIYQCKIGSIILVRIVSHFSLHVNLCANITIGMAIDIKLVWNVKYSLISMRSTVIKARIFAVHSLSHRLFSGNFPNLIEAVIRVYLMSNQKCNLYYVLF